MAMEGESLIPHTLRRARNQRRLTLAGVSSKSGLSVQHISKIESGGARGTHLLSIEKLAKALGFTLVLVPVHLAPEVRRFVNSNGRVFGSPQPQEPAS